MIDCEEKNGNKWMEHLKVLHSFTLISQFITFSYSLFISFSWQIFCLQEKKKRISNWLAIKDKKIFTDINRSVA